MEIVEIEGKTYKGTNIAKENVRGVEFSVYQLNAVTDKYLVLRNHQGTTQVFVLTGFNRIFEVLEHIRKQTHPDRLWETIVKETRTMGKPDTSLFKKKFTEHYDKEYSAFVYLGMRFPEAFQKAKESV
jgi:hypothetical protein